MSDRSEEALLDREIDELIAKIVHDKASQSELSRYQELSLLRTKRMQGPALEKLRRLREGIERLRHAV